MKLGAGTLAGVYLSCHTPRYCTLEAAVEGKLASEVFRPVRDGLVAILESEQRFEAVVHAYGPSSGSGNYVISLAGRG